MSEPKWTPGPWRINKYRSIGAGETGCQPIVAHIEPFYGEDRQFGDDGANAHLIAAAPDLYAALAEAEQQIEYLHANFSPTGTGEAVLTRARIALAKARGEQP